MMKFMRVSCVGQTNSVPSVFQWLGSWIVDAYVALFVVGLDYFLPLPRASFRHTSNRGWKDLLHLIGHFPHPTPDTRPLPQFPGEYSNRVSEDSRMIQHTRSG